MLIKKDLFMYMKLITYLGEIMRFINLLILLWIFTVMIVAPVSAFSAKQLTYDIKENGDAILTADYDISILERFGLASETVKEEISTAIQNEYGVNARVISMSESHAEIYIPKFAEIKSDSIEIPSLNFERIKERLDKYWFLGVLSIDYSPAIITIKVYTGDIFTYKDQTIIPSNTIQI